MSSIENLVYSAHDYGVRTQLLNEVTKIRKENERMPLQEVYERAYIIVMKTNK